MRFGRHLKLDKDSERYLTALTHELKLICVVGFYAFSPSRRRRNLMKRYIKLDKRRGYAQGEILHAKRSPRHLPQVSASRLVDDEDFFTVLFQNDNTFDVFAGRSSMRRHS